MKRTRWTCEVTVNGERYDLAPIIRILGMVVFFAVFGIVMAWVVVNAVISSPPIGY
jgi:hypothetical protein